MAEKAETSVTANICRHAAVTLAVTGYQVYYLDVIDESDGVTANSIATSLLRTRETLTYKEQLFYQLPTEGISGRSLLISWNFPTFAVQEGNKS